jgi:lipopolysaccharide/colanic/teichoic acid biosynthesis glycosyltransferase
MLFRQERLGHRSHPFRILKFRTMRVMEDGESVIQAAKNDSRITRVGRILRRTSIDELPQLVNVLKGEMSIIGPRPHAVAHDKLFSKLVDNYELRQHVKPGITGWAQVNGFRGETPQVELMRTRIEMDIWYATNCSLLLDAQILLRTSYELFRQRNAY